MKKNIAQEMKYVMPALATPVNRDGSFDAEGMKSLVKYVLSQGMKTLFVLGYAGECLAFSREERCKIIETARLAAGDDVLLMAGVMDDSTNLIDTHIRDACDSGADIALTTPTNFVHCTESELMDFFRDLNDRTRLPLFIYNCPENQHYLSPEMIDELSQLDNIVGLKETSNADKIQKMLLSVKQSEKFIMVSGEEFVYFPAMCLGVEGFIMGGPGNVLPGLSLAIFNDYKAGRFESARAGYFKMIGFLRELYFTLPYPTMMPQIKAMLEIGGVCKRYMTRPTHSVSDADMQVIRNMMVRHDIQL